MKLNAIEPRDENLLEMIKKYIFLGFTDDSMVRAIETKSGNKITKSQLDKMKSIAIRDKKEAAYEIEQYLKNMVTLGMFEDVKTQYETAKDLLTINHMTFIKVAHEGDINKQIALTNVIVRQMEDMRKIVTSMGYLTKIKEYNERGFMEAPIHDKGTSISVETKPKSTLDEAVAESISELDFKDNEVF